MTPEQRQLEDRIATNNAKTLHDLDRITLWQCIAYTVLFLGLLACLSACGGDIASPFEKPDRNAEPVSCAASAACG